MKAQVIETTPRSDPETIRRNLERIQKEISKVRDQAKEEADSLERIRGMIDIRYLNDLYSTIADLEARLKASERDSKADDFRRQLRKEELRLAKLWDAFKSQEDEIKQLEKDRRSLWDRLESMQRDFQGLGSVAQARSDMKRLERDNDRLSKELSEAAERADEHRGLFNAEQQRLAKLFKVYEDSVASVDSYKSEAEAWRKWYKRHGAQATADAKRAAARIKPAS